MHIAAVQTACFQYRSFSSSSPLMQLWRDACVCLHLCDGSELCFSGSPSANLNLQTNGCRAWAWKTLFRLQTLVSAQNTSGPNASGTITANSFWERMLCPLYCPMKQRRYAWAVCTQTCFVSRLSSVIMSCCHIMLLMNQWMLHRLNCAKEGWRRKRQTWWIKL